MPRRRPSCRRADRKTPRQERSSWQLAHVVSGLDGAFPARCCTVSPGDGGEPPTVRARGPVNPNLRASAASFVRGAATLLVGHLGANLALALVAVVTALS